MDAFLAVRAVAEALAPIIIVAVAVVVLELRFAWRENGVSLFRWYRGMMLMVFGWLLFSILLPGNALLAAQLADQAGFGLFHLLEIPLWVTVPIGILALDLANYLQHRIMHAVPALWRVHEVHHADETMDASIALHFHPIELLLSAGVQLVVVWLMGIPLLAVSILFTVSLLFNFWEHANIRTSWVPRQLEALFITPDLHRLHHSAHRDDHDMNFGVIFSLWDRLFGTLKRQSHHRLVFGLNTQGGSDEPGLFDLLTHPFRSGANARPGRLLARETPNSQTIISQEETKDEMV